MSSREVWMILGMALVTFAIRYPIFGFADRVKLTPSVRRALRYIPPAVLAAIVLPAMFAPDGSFDLHYTNSFLVAGIATFLIAWIGQNLLLTIVLGMAVLWLHIWMI